MILQYMRKRCQICQNILFEMVICRLQFEGFYADLRLYLSIYDSTTSYDLISWRSGLFLLSCIFNGKTPLDQKGADSPGTAQLST